MRWSPPEQNASLPSPVKTTTPTSGSSRASLNAHDISKRVWGRNALRTSGRSMVIFAMPCHFSYRMSSNLRASFHCGFMSVLLRSSSEEPGDRLGIPGGPFQIGRVAAAREEPQARPGNALGHAVRDVAEFRVVLAGEEQRWCA